MYNPCQFNREEYLSYAEVFEGVNLDFPGLELSEFNDDELELAFELAYTRYYLAKAEKLLATSIEREIVVTAQHRNQFRDEVK